MVKCAVLEKEKLFENTVDSSNWEQKMHPNSEDATQN